MPTDNNTGNTRDGEQWVYSSPVTQFAAVAREFCLLAEGASKYSSADFMKVAARLLAYLYLRAALLDGLADERGRKTMLDEPLEPYIDENAYNKVWRTISGVMGEDDEYLRVDPHDFEAEGAPSQASVSEDLADIYQALGDFCQSYRIGVEDIMNDAAITAANGFREHWGQKAADALAALNHLIYRQ